MVDSSKSFLSPFKRLAQRLKSSQLLLFVGSLFVLDVFIPDAIPLVDEIILGILTILIARWQERRASPPDPPKPPPKNVTPDAD